MRKTTLILTVAFAAVLFTGCDTAAMPQQTKYADTANWAYFADGEDKPVDVFLVAPTTGVGKGTNSSTEDPEYRDALLGTLNMERGIYEETGRLYAPYYNQATMTVYSMPEEERIPYHKIAYRDVSEAFSWYLENENNGRPIILAGFSQGADMCYRLLEEYFDDASLRQQLVAVYAIGWSCTREMTGQYPQIVPATAEDDLGVVITFDCEAPEINDTLVIPEGGWSYAINPLNWKTDSTPADASLNDGACFVGFDGVITNEVPALCGCYIDPERGSLKVPELDPAAYPALVPGMPDGAYHVYDYLFFYRDLQENVQLRTERYLEQKQ
ncbi:MAG: DUF3089 domain-containing protein [Oscillospiraceae bacterium]|nr:DUF3089 domain-containing protein [Oscillospiraceae bacterium]